MMDLIRWNPWKEMTMFEDRVSRMLGHSLFDTDPMNQNGSTGIWYPASDVLEKGDAIVIKTELPGLEKEDISLDFKNGVLTLAGERKLENEVKEENFYRKELSYGRFIRSFNLPAEIDPNAIKAEFKNGLLTIEVPKPEGQKPKQITVH
jgi:HSP20 family protein